MCGAPAALPHIFYFPGLREKFFEPPRQDSVALKVAALVVSASVKSVEGQQLVVR
jgi:hypothetical protein